jgi:glycosyltransferase involved in cell wall biosynthesis
MKIGFITTSLSSAGGWDSCSRGVIPAIARKHDVVVLTQVGAKNDPFDFPVYKVIPKNIRYQLRTQLGVFLGAMKYFRGCDVVHVMMEPYAPGLALAAKLLRAKFYITVAGTYAVPPEGYMPKAFLKRQMMRFMYNTSSSLASGSERTVEYAEKVFGELTWKFIPNGVDPELFYKDENLKKPEKPFILTVGEVKPRKGADITIEALAKIKDKFPNLGYKIVGNTGKSEFVAKLKELAKEKGLENKVELLGRISDVELRNLYNQCTIFILAAQTRDGSFEGFPMVFYEAQGCGAPIISTYGFGSEYVVKNGYNGFLVPEDDMKGLAEAIEKIAGNPELQKELHKNSLIEAEKHTWDATADKYINMYQKDL